VVFRHRNQVHRSPLLSVVVPAFNVERYLGECLTSLVEQNLAGQLEVVIVDDGSTDRSGAIGRSFVSGRPGWHLLRTENRGLGAARNTGVRHTHGQYLTFLDSDDMMLPGAYEGMLSTLEASNSDFAVGSAKRNFATGLQQPPWLRRVHRERRIAVTLNEFPAILGNAVAWSKMFRRSFWDRQQLCFPEGMVYEDQVTVTKAYLVAEAFDILVRPLVYWRIRDDGSSITQHRASLIDVRDRFLTKRMTTDLIERLGSAQVLHHWYTRVVITDLPIYFRAIPGASDEYWSLLTQGLRELWRNAPPFSETSLRPWEATVASLVLQGRRRDAEKAVALANDAGSP
jgi:glycosyltransferase involved in cell wall biosynthesis